MAGLRAGLNVLTAEDSPGELELDPDIFRSPVTVTVNAEMGGGKVALLVQASGPGEYVCDRCGDEFTMLVGGECRVVFIQRDKPLPDEEPGDDLRSFRLGQEELDISTEVRDSLLLSVPMKLLCDEACRGICPRCNANLNREGCRCVGSQPSAVSRPPPTIDN